MSFTSAPDIPESRWRDVRIAAVARGASIGGDMLAATALLLALQGRGESGLALAAVLIAASAPLVLLAPLSGRLVDRVDSRLLLTAVGLAQAACCVAMAYARSTPVLVERFAPATLLIASGILGVGAVALCMLPVVRAARRERARAAPAPGTADPASAAAVGAAADPSSPAAVTPA